MIADYERVFRLREAGASLRARGRRPEAQGSASDKGDAAVSGVARRALERTGARVGRRAVATGFAWMFSGARLPAPHLVDLVLAGADRWLSSRAAS